MRALVLILLCVVLLAVLQASYIVTEAKKHNDMRAMDEGERYSKHEKKMRRKGKKGTETTDLDIADDVASPKNELSKSDDGELAEMMADDAGAGGERSGRRERVSKQERRERKEQRQAAKAAKQAAKAERQAKKAGGANRQAKKEQRKAERQAERQAGGKKGGRGGRGGRQGGADQVACASDADCQTGECCVPKRGGEMFCKANRKPRRAGKKCITSCTCDGDLACYLENPLTDAAAGATEAASPQRGGRGARAQLGKCVAPSDADLSKGTILTSAPANAEAPPA